MDCTALRTGQYSLDDDDDDDICAIRHSILCPLGFGHGRGQVVTDVRHPSTRKSSEVATFVLLEPWIKRCCPS